jgi:two-component system LytT family response regulator
VRIDEIIRCEASNNYTNFVLENGRTVLVCKTLKEFDELLKPYGFIRPHQSHLVNVNCVRSYLREDGGLLLMKDEIKVPIARQKRESIKDALGRI